MDNRAEGSSPEPDKQLNEPGNDDHAQASPDKPVHSKHQVPAREEIPRERNLSNRPSDGEGAWADLPSQDTDEVQSSAQPSTALRGAAVLSLTEGRRRLLRARRFREALGYTRTLEDPQAATDTANGGRSNASNLQIASRGIVRSHSHMWIDRPLEDRILERRGKRIGGLLANFSPHGSLSGSPDRSVVSSGSAFQGRRRRKTGPTGYIDLDSEEKNFVVIRLDELRRETGGGSGN